MRFFSLVSMVLMFAPLCFAQFPQDKLEIHKGVVLSYDDCGYTIKYDMGDFRIVDTMIIVNDKEMRFSSVEFLDDFYDRVEVDGRPAFPLCGLDLRISSLKNEISIVQYKIATKEIELQYDYIPTLANKVDGEIIGTIDEKYYSSEQPWKGMMHCEYNLYEMPRNVGMNVGFCPFHYDPCKRILTMVTSVVLRIEMHDCALKKTLSDLNLIALHHFDNYIQFKPDLFLPAANGERYLILASNELAGESLHNFADYKKSIGYTVDIRLCPNDVKANANEIIAFLQEYYKEYPDLLYVLLVGTPNLIPFASDEDILSDLKYVRWPSQNKWNQFNYHYYLGRWPVENEEELNNVVEKTIRNEKNLSVCPHYRMAAVSSLGRGQLAFYHDAKWMYSNFDTISDISVDLIDGRKASADCMFGKFNKDNDFPLWLFFYSGHGLVDRLGDPYYWKKEKSVKYFENADVVFQPFAFVFACDVGDVSYSDCFSRHWLVDRDGGVSILSSTMSTHIYPDRFFSRNLLSPLIDKKNLNLGELVYGGKERYYLKCKTEPRRRTINRYNLYGDPSLYLFGAEWHDGFAILKKNRNIESVEAIDETNTLSQIAIFTMQGQCVYRGSDSNIAQLSGGIYVVCRNLGSEEREFEKIIVK